MNYETIKKNLNSLKDTKNIKLLIKNKNRIFFLSHLNFGIIVNKHNL